MVALFLSLVTAALPLAGCSGSGTKNENRDKTVSSQDAEKTAADESPAGQSEEDAGSETEPSGLTVSGLIKARYADTDLGGYVYRVMAPPPGGHFYQNGDNEIWADELTGEVVNDAIFSRNLSAEETLKFRIEPVWGGKDEEIQNQLHNEVLAGGTGYDAALNSMTHMGINWSVDFSWGGNIMSLYSNIYNLRQNTFVSLAAKKQSIIDEKLKELVDSVTALDY